MTQQQIYEEVAKELNLSVDMVKYTYYNYWKYIRTIISGLPLKDSNFTEEEFNSLPTCFNIPSLGKLHCTYPRYKNMKLRLQIIKQLKNEYKENHTEVYNSSDYHA